MRTILSVVLALFVMYGLLKFFKENALQQVEYDRHFERVRLYAGDTIQMRVELSNHKLLPLPWLRISAIYPAAIEILEQKLQKVEGSSKMSHISITSLFAFQKVTKYYRVFCSKRGHYTFCDVDMKAGDWFGLEKAESMFYNPKELIVYPKVVPLVKMGFEANSPDGTVSVRRWIMPDPIEKMSLREYTTNDPFHTIDWKATARSGKMMVGNFDFKADPALMILLNTAHFKSDWKYKCPSCFEDLIDLSASLIEAAALEGVAVGMSYTASVQSANAGHLIMPDERGEQRVILLEILAKLSEYNKLSPEEMLMLYEKIYEPTHTVFFLSESLTTELVLRLNHLRSRGYQLHVCVMEQPDCLHLIDPGICVHTPAVVREKGGETHVQMA